MEKKKENLLKALKKTRGDITAACRALDMARQTFYRWKEADEEFAQAYEEINAEGLDYAKSVIFKAMEMAEPKPKINYKTGDFFRDEHGEEILFQPDAKEMAVAKDAAEFYLERKGKHEGWSPKTEFEDVTERERIRVADLFPPTDELDRQAAELVKGLKEAEELNEKLTPENNDKKEEEDPGTD